MLDLGEEQAALFGKRGDGLLEIGVADGGDAVPAELGQGRGGGWFGGGLDEGGAEGCEEHGEGGAEGVEGDGVRAVRGGDAVLQEEQGFTEDGDGRRGGNFALVVVDAVDDGVGKVFLFEGDDFGGEGDEVLGEQAEVLAVPGADENLGGRGAEGGQIGGKLPLFGDGVDERDDVADDEADEEEAIGGGDDGDDLPEAAVRPVVAQPQRGEGVADEVGAIPEIGGLFGVGVNDGVGAGGEDEDPAEPEQDEPEQNGEQEDGKADIREELVVGCQVTVAVYQVPEGVSDAKAKDAAPFEAQGGEEQVGDDEEDDGGAGKAGDEVYHRCLVQGSVAMC